VSAEAEESGHDELATSPRKLRPRSEGVHWSALLLIAAAYFAIWGSYAAATKEQEAFLMQLHRSLGVTVVCADAISFGLAMACADPEPAGRSSAIQRWRHGSPNMFFMRCCWRSRSWGS